MADTPNLGLHKPVITDMVDVVTAINANMDKIDASAVSTSLPLTHDLSGTIASPTVAKVNGVAITGTPSSGQVPKASSSTAAAWSTLTVSDLGAPTGDVAFGSHKITALADPSSAQDAATKTYVDTANALALPKSGGTMTGALTLNADPSSALHAATKQYVDAHAGGGATTSAWATCACATTANITLSGEQTIDGVTTSTSRVLVKNQTTGSQNGIYVSAAGAWSRATDADTSGEVVNGNYVFISGGTTQANTSWILTTPNTITLGTTSLTFSQMPGVTYPISVGNGGTGSTTAAAAIAALGGLPTAGGTMTGNITLAGAPSANLHPATKLYVDTATALALPTAGGTMTGSLTLAADPSTSLQAATKQYVDAHAGSGAWTASPAWVAAFGAASAWTSHATYTCVGTPATDGAAIRALCALGSVIFTPGTYVLDTATANSIKACVRFYQGNKYSALIPGTVTIQLANSSVVNNLVAPLGAFTTVACNASAGSSTVDQDIEVDGLIFDWNAANQGTGVFDVGPCATFRGMSGLLVQNCTSKNWRGTAGSSSTAKTSTVTANGTDTVVITAGTALAAGDVGHAVAGGNIGVAGTTTILAVTGSNIKLSTTIAAGSFTMYTSNSAQWIFEKWGFDNFTCQDIEFRDIECYSDNPTVYGGTGFNFLYGTRGYFKGLHIHDNKFNGIGCHSSEMAIYEGIRSYRNSSGMLIESGRDVKITNSLFGGHSSFYTTKYEPLNTTWGNAAIGLGVNQSEAVLVSNCEFGNNGTALGAVSCNVQLDASHSTEGPGLTEGKYEFVNCHAYGGGKYNFSILNGAGAVSKLTNVRMWGAGTADVYNASYTGGMNLSKQTGGHISSARTPAVPAANATVTSNHPWTVLVTVSGGIAVNIVVDGNVTNSATTAVIEPGSTIGLGNYTGSPTWTWYSIS